MKVENKQEKLKINLSNIPLDSSLGHLALGDLAFVAWRKVKKAHSFKIDTKSKMSK